MFELSFMRYAFIASTFIAIVSGVIGVFRGRPADCRF